jgi:hypothetical protein
MDRNTRFFAPRRKPRDRSLERIMSRTFRSTPALNKAGPTLNFAPQGQATYQPRAERSDALDLTSTQNMGPCKGGTHWTRYTRLCCPFRASSNHQYPFPRGVTQSAKGEQVNTVRKSKR